MAERDKGKYKPCSFYVPEKDLELMRFMAAQSNMSLSMRLLMKAFLASNRHQTDIDVSMMDLADLIRSMRVDPELFEDVPKRHRQPRSISAIEGEEIRAREQAALAQREALGTGYDQAQRSVPGFSQAGADTNPGGYSPPPAPQPAPVQAYRSDPGQMTGQVSEPVLQPAGQTAGYVGTQPSSQPPAEQVVQSAPQPAPESVSKPPVQHSSEPAAQPPAQSAPATEPAPEPAAGGEEELDPMDMMGGM